MQRTVISDINGFVGGMGHIGLVESFKTPAIKQIKLTHKSGAGDTSVSTGMFESLDTEISIKSLPQSIYEEIAKLDEAELVFKKATKVGNETQSHEYTCIGSIDLEYGEAKHGEFFDVKLTQKGLRKYTYEYNNKVKIDIDHDNGKAEIGGKDLVSEARKIVGS